MTLPPTIFHKNGDDRIDYRIRAQFIPHLATDWVDPGSTLSCLRSNDFYIRISRPLEPIIMNPDVAYRYNLVTASHTFLGMGKKTETNTTFEFYQSKAFPLTNVECRILCDNSKCKKDVEKFVFKWYCLTSNRTM
jgi:hypothetical protein